MDATNGRIEIELGGQWFTLDAEPLKFSDIEQAVKMMRTPALQVTFAPIEHPLSFLLWWYSLN